MTLDQLAGWVAPSATMAAAVMTASNLGARVTGWGFVVFTVASLAWCTVALTTDQANLLWANGFLVGVNLMGVWRWLGRQARFERAGDAAAVASIGAATATIEPISRVIGAAVLDSAGQKAGVILDALADRKEERIVYFVMSDGGVGGVGERLYGLTPAEVRLGEGQVRLGLSLSEVRKREPLTKDEWPPQLSSRQAGL